VRVALYQNNPVFGRINKNIDAVINDIGDENFDLLVLPELIATGYQFKDTDEALKLADRAGEGETFYRMQELAKAKDALIIYGFPEKDGEKPYNSSLAVLPDGSYHCYRKTHLFDTEKAIFCPGDTGFSVFTYGDVKIGMMICFDWRFPEAARKLALLGAQIICHPANLVMPHCPDAMLTRALENNVFTITADRIGDEARTGQPLHFIGKSRIISPGGEILVSMGEENTGFIAVDIDPSEADNKAITPGNDIFADRRVEFY
jgi:predicted amidohydrolase